MIIVIIILNVRELCIARLSQQSAQVMLKGIKQFYLPNTRFIPAREEQDLEQYTRYELLNSAAHFSDLGRMEA